MTNVPNPWDNNGPNPWNNDNKSSQSPKKTKIVNFEINKSNRRIDKL